MVPPPDDFKPQSVDSKRPGRLKITQEGAVNVSLPVGQVHVCCCVWTTCTDGVLACTGGWRMLIRRWEDVD